MNTFADISIVIGDIFLDVFLFYDAANVNLLGFLELVFLFLFYVLLDNCIDLSASHIIFDLLG